MAKFKIGATDGGDAGLDLSWENKMNSVDGAILITKCISPDFVDGVLRFRDKLIVHSTITGYGGTVLEPYVPRPYEQYDATVQLVKKGFPKERVVVRVDPIIPTAKGVSRALNVLKTFMDAGFQRYRISMIDMYPHVRERFKQAGIPAPYGGNFSPGKAQEIAVDAMLAEAIAYWQYIGNYKEDLRIEACAEPGITNAIQCGCVSEYDLQLMGLIQEGEALDDVGYQRRHCLCYSGKVELLTDRKPCPHQCLYCFWK